MKYLCINCKKEFDKIPPIKSNECFAGYYHTFIKNSSIINREVSGCSEPKNEGQK